mmetsp:Transcript_84115/g.168437  ORF Transcript_84115/g.168437 Transcript_84115/m.168437 type:complete len:606 (-) Transcript_84115:345-2162(-)
MRPLVFCALVGILPIVVGVTSSPTHAPTATEAPTGSRAPVHAPTQVPTDIDPTPFPTLSPTSNFDVIGQRLQILLSFLVLLIAYGVHSCTKPSEMATRGLDPKLFKIREFRVEKQWGCKFCGYQKNVASSPLCMQCGTNQLGEQQILPSATTKGTASEHWTVRTRVDVTQHEVSGNEGKRVLTWERETWPFRMPNGGAASNSGQSEVPTSLALAEHGFMVVEQEAFLGGSSARQTPGGDKWGTKRLPAQPTSVELQGGNLAWVSAVAGVPVNPNVSSELLTDLAAQRNSFYPEKVAWFYDQISRLRVEAMNEYVPTEFGTAYPNSVLRDSLGILNKVTPLQVLMGNYRIQFVASRSHTRVTSVAGDLEEKWLQALFAQISDPSCGILTPCDDGSLELAGNQPPLSSGGSGDHLSSEKHAVDADELSFFTALGRAIAMAVVSRTFVSAQLSPALCKLILGRPCHFLDLLNSKQELFRDLLKLLMLPPDAVEKLKLRLHDTTMEPPKKERRDTQVTGRGTTTSDWAGRGAKRGDRVMVGNRTEYAYRKLEHQLFGRAKPQLAALRRALFEVIPQELFAVFDHSEFLMLLNGHHATDADTTTSAKVFV